MIIIGAGISGHSAAEYLNTLGCEVLILEVCLLLKENFELDNQNTLQISLTREELANMVGTATESVIRLLSEFKQDKLIELQGRKIKFLDIPSLRRVANI